MMTTSDQVASVPLVAVQQATRILYWNHKITPLFIYLTFVLFKLV